MNLAFLVEGMTELRLYPKWIDHFSNSSLSECITGYQDVVSDQFTIFNVSGIGKMRTEIPAAIQAINGNPVFDYLIIVVDADDNNIAKNESLIQGIFDDADTPQLPVNCQVKIIVQQVCIETWFIGHTDHYLIAKESPDKGIKSFMAEYDVENDDPEMMPNNPASIIHSIGAYHTTFLTKMLKGANRSWRYNKTTAHNLIDIPYIQRLEQRLLDSPTHLKSFSDTIVFLKSI
jgi:hypothetical protein